MCIGGGETTNVYKRNPQKVIGGLTSSCTRAHVARSPRWWSPPAPTPRGAWRCCRPAMRRLPTPVWRRASPAPSGGSSSSAADAEDCHRPRRQPRRGVRCHALERARWQHHVLRAELEEQWVPRLGGLPRRAVRRSVRLEPRAARAACEALAAPRPSPQEREARLGPRRCPHQPPRGGGSGPEPSFASAGRTSWSASEARFGADLPISLGARREGEVGSCP